MSEGGVCKSDAVRGHGSGSMHEQPGEEGATVKHLIEKFYRKRLKILVAILKLFSNNCTILWSVEVV